MRSITGTMPKYWSPATSAGRGTGFGPFTFIVTSGCQETSFFQASFHVPGHSIERLRSVEHGMLCRRRGETVSFSAYLLGHETPPADLGHRSVCGFYFRAAKVDFKRIRIIVFVEIYMNNMPTRRVITYKAVRLTSM